MDADTFYIFLTIFLVTFVLCLLGLFWPEIAGIVLVALVAAFILTVFARPFFRTDAGD